jgi:hypothetical protein
MIVATCTVYLVWLASGVSSCIISALMQVTLSHHTHMQGPAALGASSIRRGAGRRSVQALGVGYAWYVGWAGSVVDTRGVVR